MAEAGPQIQSDLERMRALQQARRGGAGETPAEETPGPERNPAAELIRARAEARREAEERTEAEEGSEASAGSKSATVQGGKLVTAQLLQKSWLGLIPSWGLSAIYLNLHFVAKYILGLRVFCEFGEEWILAAPMGKQLAAQGQQPKIGAAKYGEFILLLLVDAIIALILAAIIALIAVLVYAVRHWWNIATLLLSK